jgi:hypothetical protein
MDRTVSFLTSLMPKLCESGPGTTVPYNLAPDLRTLYLTPPVVKSGTLQVIETDFNAKSSLFIFVLPR